MVELQISTNNNNKNTSTQMLVLIALGYELYVVNNLDVFHINFVCLFLFRRFCKQFQRCVLRISLAFNEIRDF